MEALPFTFLIFIFISLYFTLLMLILFFKNYNKLFQDEEPISLPTISVLIPAYNEENTIGETIKAVKNIDYPKNLLEIIVIDDGSTDNTLKEIKKFKDIKIISKENSGKADSLNQGIKIAKGEIITVIDADSYPARDSFKRMLHYFKDEEVGAVTSTIIVKNKAKILEKMQVIEYFLIAWARKLLDYIGSVYVTPGPLSMYRKKALIEVGGFDTKNLTEDIEIAWKLLKHNYRNRMCLSAKVYTTVPNTIKKWWRQRLRWDIGGLQTAVKYRSSLFKKRHKIFGLFITPKFLVSHVLSLTGFFIFLYLILRKLIGIILSTKYATSSDISPLAIYSLKITPTVFTFFIVVFFILTLFYTYYGLKTISKARIGIKGNLNILCYLILYLALYPLVLIYAIYSILTKNVKW